MSATDQALKEARQWLSSALADLEAAQTLLDHEGAAFVICFHAQQAAEKAIKAAYVWMNAPFERTHDLDRLVNLLPGEWRFPGELTDLASLTYWAVEGRYPGDWPMVMNEEAVKSVSAARRIYEIIRDELGEKGYRD